MRKRIIGMFFIFCMTFAFAEEKWATVSIAEQKNFTIPFTIDETTFLPVISVKVGTTSLGMGIDIFGVNTPANAYTSLVRNVGGDDMLNDTINSIKKEAELQHPGEVITDALMQEAVDSNMVSITLENFCINGVDLGTVIMSYRNAEENIPELKNINGVLSVYFFHNCRNLVIDYRNNAIVVNADSIGGAESPLRRFNEMAVMQTRTTINGVKQDALIAPSLSAVYLRDEYGKQKDYTDEEVLSCLEKRKFTNRYKNVEIQLGSRKISCKGYFFARSRLDLLDGWEFAMKKVNFLGYPVFKGHRIQLDFENWVFRMD